MQKYIGVKINLTKQQADKLNDVLFMAQDEGPTGEGWVSEELKDLREVIAQQIINSEGLSMNKYVGVKTVLAKPMKLGEYNKLQGWDMPADQNPEMEGYLVEYLDGGKANHPGFLGYISWCPKEQFENANRRIDGMTFGHAIEMAKAGYRIARAGWNGKGMFVVYQPGYPDGIPCNANTAAAFGYELGELFKCRPYLQMRCADGTHQMWLASQSDILEEDWEVV